MHAHLIASCDYKGVLIRCPDFRGLLCVHKMEPWIGVLINKCLY